MSEYTPTTDDVKIRYSLFVSEEDPFEAEEAFNAWLAELKADAWEEGFDAGERDVFEHDEKDEWGKEHTCLPNPYRQGETSE